MRILLVLQGRSLLAVGTEPELAVEVLAVLVVARVVTLSSPPHPLMERTR
jgi:hypothetical protein